MRDFFEIDINDVDHSSYKQFVTRGLGDKFLSQIEIVDKEFKEMIDKVVGPKQKVLNIFYYLTFISVIGFMTFALLFVQNLANDKPFPYGMLIGLFVCLALVITFGLLQIKTKKEYNKLLKSDKVVKMSEKNQEIEEMVKKELGVPSECEKIDIFVRQVYFKNNQKINAIRQSYNNYALYAYKKNNRIIFCDTYENIELKLSEVTKVKLINDRITFQNWNKKEPMADAKYRQYKVKPMARGGIIVNCFYQIELNHNDVDYLIRIPGYEKEFIEQNFNDFEIEVEGGKNENK